jgi:hypothetical protein
MLYVILGADPASDHLHMVAASAAQLIHLQKAIVNDMLIDPTS